MKNKLAEIAEAIYSKTLPTDSRPNYGFLGGDMGEIFFLYWYSILDKEYEEKADEMLDSLIDKLSLNSSFFSGTYCDGLAGIGVALHLLEENGFLEDVKDMLEDVNEFLKVALTYEIRKNLYDFLHASVGIGFYFLKHYKYNPELCKEQIEKLYSYLEETAIRDEENNTIKWKAIQWIFDKNSHHADFNISLSHGMSSIIIFLARILDLNIIDKEKVTDMMNKAINYILAQRIDHKVYGSYFPSVALESTQHLTTSRLAWCYGDLGVALALWHAGKSLNRTYLKDLSLEIFLFSSERRDPVSEYVNDAGLCHGSAGLSQIFYRMFLETGRQEFHETYSYWKEITLKMAYHTDGPGGYKSYTAKTADTEPSWVDAYGVLTGIAGIGLSLMAEENSKWDELLLLSFA